MESEGRDEIKPNSDTYWNKYSDKFGMNIEDHSKDKSSDSEQTGKQRKKKESRSSSDGGDDHMKTSKSDEPSLVIPSKTKENSSSEGEIREASYSNDKDKDKQRGEKTGDYRSRHREEHNSRTRHRERHSSRERKGTNHENREKRGERYQRRHDSEDRSRDRHDKSRHRRRDRSSSRHRYTDKGRGESREERYDRQKAKIRGEDNTIGSGRTKGVGEDKPSSRKGDEGEVNLASEGTPKTTTGTKLQDPVEESSNSKDAGNKGTQPPEMSERGIGESHGKSSKRFKGDSHYSGRKSGDLPSEHKFNVHSKRRTHDDDRDASKRSKESGGDIPTKKAKILDITTKSGGAYIPPAKLRLMQEEITDKSSLPYQRIAWEALKKSLNGLINKVNVSNIAVIVRELFKENMILGRGLLCRAVIQAQAVSPTFTHVYAALMGIINSKFPQIGELLLKRLIIQFKRGFRLNNKLLCLSSTRFLAHLVNQQVAHEVIALEILTLLLENPTEDSVEVAVGFLKECGKKLTDVSPRGILAIFERLRNVLHEGNLDKRVQYILEVMFQIRKDEFKDHPTIIEELDLVEEEDQFTHLLGLDDAIDVENNLNVFRHDLEYEENENKYKQLRQEILDEGSSDEDSGEEGEGDGEGSEEGSEAEEGAEGDSSVIDKTETNLVTLRRTIYLTIQSSLDYEECAHKFLKMELKPGEEAELAHMILDCCAQMRTYEKFFGLLAQRFCNLNKVYMDSFEVIFHDSYDTVHRFDTNKLRNVAKFFGHLLYTDAIPWTVLGHIKLNEDDTTSSSRIFIKILFQELAEHMGLQKLYARIIDTTLQEAFDGLFPRDNPRNTRFAINFFTSIGLGGLTDELREHLKNAPKPTAIVKPQVQELMKAIASSSDSSSDSSSQSSSDSSDESSDSSSSSSSSSSSDSSDQDSDQDKRARKRPKKHKPRVGAESKKSRVSVEKDRKKRSSVEKSKSELTKSSSKSKDKKNREKLVSLKQNDDKFQSNKKVDRSSKSKDSNKKSEKSTKYEDNVREDRKPKLGSSRREQENEFDTSVEVPSRRKTSKEVFEEEKILKDSGYCNFRMTKYKPIQWAEKDPSKTKEKK